MYTETFTNIHATHKVTMQKAVFNHICEMMRQVHHKEGNIISPATEAVIQEQASKDLNHILISGNLITYYNRMKAGQV